MEERFAIPGFQCLLSPLFLRKAIRQATVVVDIINEGESKSLAEREQIFGSVGFIIVFEGEFQAG